MAAFGPAPVGAQANPFQRGPTPTTSSLNASSGPFSVSTASVGLGASGFGGGTVYYPTSTSEGTFGGVVIAPGFMTNAPEKAYVELNSESHMAAATNPADQGRAMVAWLKRYVDDDTRYDAFTCPPPSSSDYTEWRNTCPNSGGGTTPPPTTPPGEECEWWEWWCTESNAIRGLLGVG